MMARILAHQRDLGNGVGLHYSGFHRFSAVPAPSNQLLASIPPRKNRYYCQPIREDGLSANPQTYKAVSSRRATQVRHWVVSRLSAAAYWMTPLRRKRTPPHP